MTGKATVTDITVTAELMSDSTVPWIALVRHGVTDWNARGLIQGQTDIPLSPAGAAKLRQTAAGIADDFRRARWFASSLTRARQTAALLNPAATVTVAAALAEANWGEFEGLRRDDLAARIRELGITPRRGLDFRPPGGESAREVRRRLAGWFAEVAAGGDIPPRHPRSPRLKDCGGDESGGGDGDGAGEGDDGGDGDGDGRGRPVVAVVHKGVLRSALSLACDWDMAADFDATFGVTVRWDAPQVFRVDGDGRVRLLRLNCPWDEPPGDGDGDYPAASPLSL